MRRLLDLAILALLVAGALVPGAASAQAPPAHPPVPETVDSLLMGLVDPHASVRHQALQKLHQLGDRSAIPALIEVMRFDFDRDLNVGSVLEPLSGQKLGNDWGKWVEWLARQPDLKPSPGFVKFKSELFTLIDPAFAEFLYPGVKHRIRLEEIVWGGVRKDGIPAITNPRHVRPGLATYLQPDELVLGLSVKGQQRAYPLRIMDWHEMANDVLGGTPVTIAY